MIRGVVNARREACVSLRMRGPGGAEAVLNAVVDTGCSASLMLPAATIAALALTRQSGGRAVLADGSIRQFDLYSGEVEWLGSWRPVLVTDVGDEVLIGMGLLAGHELRIEVVPGGTVEVQGLP